jgi:hypothetical protein
MGYNTRNDEIRDDVVRMRRESTTRRAWNRAGSMRGFRRSDLHGSGVRMNLAHKKRQTQMRSRRPRIAKNGEPGNDRGIPTTPAQKVARHIGHIR